VAAGERDGRFQRTMRLSIVGWLFAGVFSAGAVANEEPEPLPWETSAWGVESGVLWENGVSTPISYRLLQTQFSWRSPEVFGHEFHDGSRVVVRHRLTLIGTIVQNGPESHYIAFSGSPSVEWWNRAASWSLFAGAGGGAGGIDSRGIKGGQGQDFTFNWFARAGLEHVMKRNLRLSAAIMFQHMSNGGQTKPNPGIDGLGFMLGCAWSR
jgi:lipid A 3-O-deacylase